MAENDIPPDKLALADQITADLSHRVDTIVAHYRDMLREHPDVEVWCAMQQQLIDEMTIPETMVYLFVAAVRKLAMQPVAEL